MNTPKETQPGGCARTPCSPSSTPETDAYVAQQNSDGWNQNPQDRYFMRKLERERNILQEALQGALIDLVLTEGLSTTPRSVIRHISISKVRTALWQVSPENETSPSVDATE